MVDVPEGWKPKDSMKLVAEKGGHVPNSVGQPMLDENEVVVEDGFANSRQYFLIEDKDGNFRVEIPGVGKNNECYKGPKRKIRPAALEDGFKVLNNQLPEDFLGRAQRRFPSGNKS
jgi:hypothetical protein